MMQIRTRFVSCPARPQDRQQENHPVTKSRGAPSLPPSLCLFSTAGPSQADRQKGGRPASVSTFRFREAPALARDSFARCAQDVSLLAELRGKPGMKEAAATGSVWHVWSLDWEQGLC